MAVRKQRPVSASKERPVKTTISLDVELYSRLCAKAAKRRTGISALAVEFIREGLRGVVVIDRNESSGRGTGNDRAGQGLGVIDSEEDAA